MLCCNILFISCLFHDFYSGAATAPDFFIHIIVSLLKNSSNIWHNHVSNLLTGTYINDRMI